MALGGGIAAEHAMSTFEIIDTMFRVTALCWCFAFHALHSADDPMRERSLATLALFGVCVASGSGRSFESVWWPVASVVSRLGWLGCRLERRSMRVEIGSALLGSGGGGKLSRSLPMRALSDVVDCFRRWCMCGRCNRMSSCIGVM